MACTSCNTMVPVGATFCTQCGAPQAQVGARDAQNGGSRDHDLSLLVAEKQDFYLAKFKFFQVGPIEKFELTWNWPACLYSFWWLIYRKMYIPALVVFLLDCVPIVGPLAVCIGLGIGGNFLYYKHVNKQLQKTSVITDPNARNSALVQLGGVNKWVTNVAIGVMVLAAIIGFLAAMRH